MKMKSEWDIRVSSVAERTSNPIRVIVDRMGAQVNPLKNVISLALGDPSTFGNLNPHQSTVDAVQKALLSNSANGYPPSIGHEFARAAVAAKYTRPEAPLTAKVLATNKGIEPRFYDLVPERCWEIDLEHFESLIDENTAALIVNSPSNPCGSVYSKEHLLAIIAIAEKHKVPIIADEIYADMVFKGFEFHPMASLTTTVPILSVGGVSKRYLVPGWRVGWILIHDRNNLLTEIRKGIYNLTQLIVGCNSLVQSALPDILNAPQSFYDNTIETLEKQAMLSYDTLKAIPGLKPVLPQGAMYMMVEIDTTVLNFEDEVDFASKLLQEESVGTLPGKCFRCKSYFVRLVITPPEDMLIEAYDRIRQFCARHMK
ncbi:hypothetical protein HK098_005411 [Nowakowskiella sp. JEL0407]|nr:hypothetical protein HK098_005411 [Nowakowskiella sp. JEL0407]